MFSFNGYTLEQGISSKATHLVYIHLHDCMHCRSFVCVSLYQCCVLVKTEHYNLTLFRLLEKVTKFNKCLYSNCEVRDSRSQCALSQCYKIMLGTNNAISVSCCKKLLQFYCSHQHALHTQQYPPHCLPHPPMHTTNKCKAYLAKWHKM